MITFISLSSEAGRDLSGTDWNVRAGRGGVGFTVSGVYGISSVYAHDLVVAAGLVTRGCTVGGGVARSYSIRGLLLMVLPASYLLIAASNSILNSRESSFLPILRCLTTSASVHSCHICKASKKAWCKGLSLSIKALFFLSTTFKPMRVVGVVFRRSLTVHFWKSSLAAFQSSLSYTFW